MVSLMVLLMLMLLLLVGVSCAPMMGAGLHVAWMLTSLPGLHDTIDGLMVLMFDGDPVAVLEVVS